MPALVDLTGLKFNRLRVVKRMPKISGKKPQWECLCDCGNISIAYSADLKSNKHRSCGCLHIESITKHGAAANNTVSPTYRSWLSMRERCNNPNATGYEHYGGRGISVCSRWDSFSAFLSDVGERPSMKYSIDRRDNDGNYKPSNCKWSTRIEQAQNKRERSFYTIPKRDTKTGRFISN